MVTTPRSERLGHGTRLGRHRHRRHRGVSICRPVPVRHPDEGYRRAAGAGPVPGHQCSRAHRRRTQRVGDPDLKGTGIGVTALEAYGNAAEINASLAPSAGSPGRHWRASPVLSKHGRHHGRESRPAATSARRFVVRNSMVPTATCGWSTEAADAGRRKPQYVPRRGPFQFLPETWQRYGVDATATAS